MDPTLRTAPTIEAVDPLTLVPQPGEMTQLYYDARWSPDNPDGYPDGMSLVCATPLKPYGEIVEDYVRQKDEPGFSPRRFWDANFKTPGPNDGLVIAPEGMDIDAYIQAVRPTFIKSGEAQGGFDFDLPFEYPGAGGRFDWHLFPHDAYHILKGWAADGRWDKIIDCIDDMEYEIMYLGYPANGNSGIYASRFQMPYFSHAVRMLSEKFGDAALLRYLPALEREYNYHMYGVAELPETPAGVAAASRCVVRMPNGTLLNRYWDDAEGPRLESLKEDVDLGKLVVHGLTGAAREARLAKFYKDMRSAAGSGWDFSSRWFADGQNIETICTTDIVPIDLNCLLVDSAETLTAAYTAKARQAAAAGEDPTPYLERSRQYGQDVQQRKEGIVTYLYDPVKKIFGDFNFVEGRLTGIESAAMAFPLYIGMTNEEQTFGVAEAIRDRFLHIGGIICTLNDTGEQWDGRNVWASPNWAAIRGLARMAHILMAQNIDTEELFVLAEQARSAFLSGIETVFAKYGIIPEKIDGFDPTQLAGGGEYELVKLLNMTMETYRAMKAWNPREPGGCLPIGRFVVARV
jgi:alpha,alpha-trehalase